MTIASRLVVATLLAAVVPAYADTYDVDRTDDIVSATACTAAPDDCSLRGAIIASNTHVGADTVSVPAGTYTVTIAGAGEDNAATGDLDIRDDVSLVGAAAAVTIIDGGGLDRVFHTDPAGTATIDVTISSVTIQHGVTAVIAFVLANGGAILNGSANTATSNAGGKLTITETVVQDSSTPRMGGGIGNAGSLVVTDSVLSGNSAGTLGGGIAQDDTGSASITRATIIGNHADEGAGGGLYLGIDSITTDPLVTIVDSTISGNRAQNGGGVFRNRGTLTATNTTISGNVASSNGVAGAGIFDTANGVTLRNCTITNNNAPESGPGGISGSGTTLVNTIVAGNIAFRSPDCSDTVNSGGYNLIGNTTGCTISGDTTGNVIDQAAVLGPLADNGGPTETHELLAGSPALDAGNPAAPGSGGTACEATDQRGVARPEPAGGRCDMGAFERVGGAPTTSTTSLPTTTSTSSSTTSSSTTTSTSSSTTSSSTTTTSTTQAPTTTTTTLPSICSGGATFASIVCRLEVVIAEVTASSDLGRLQGGILSRVTKARDRTASGETSCAAAKLHATKAVLKTASRTTTSAIARIESLNGRHIIPALVAAHLTTELRAIESDLKTLRSGVHCP